MALASTHGQILAAAGGTVAGRTSLGTLTLPAGGPWKIHGLHASVVRATGTAGELNGGFIDIAALSGDVTPNILPAQFPIYESGSSLGATLDQSICPTMIYDVDWEAAGKAIIEIGYTQDTTVTVAPQIVAGIMFGPSAPQAKPAMHCARVRAAVAAAADTAVGTITLPESAKEITGIVGVLMQDGVLTTAEELTGFWRMTSDDFDLTPAQFPFANVYGAGLGILINGASGMFNSPIPVTIPVVGGSRINIFVDLNTAVTNAAQVDVYLMFN
jgi:hypothetical protein